MANVNGISVTGAADIEGAPPPPPVEINNTSILRLVGNKFRQAVDSVNQIVASIVVPIGRVWNNIGRAVFGEQVVVIMPPSTLTFIITALLAFAEIKSQVNTDFPFHTHPQTVMLSITSLVVYGFASLAEVVIAAAGFDHASFYAVVARLGRVTSLSVLVASLVSLFYY